MVSSLAAQLAQNASLNSAHLLEKSRRKATQSYLFTAREAEHHDLESIHALGLNGFLQLSSLEPSLRQYEDILFSDAAKITDRTLLTEEDAKKVDLAIDSFLPLIGPYILEGPTGRVLEWLVRRFRSALVNIILSPTNADFSRFVSERLSAVLQTENASPALGALYRGLIAFHTGTLLEFLKRVSGNSLDENTLAWVLPAVMDPLNICSSIEVAPSKQSLVLEVILSSYLLLAALSNSRQLSSKLISAILKAIAVSANTTVGASPKHIVRTIVGVCSAQEKEKIGDKSIISKKVVKTVLKLQNVEQEIVECLRFSNFENFVEPFLKALISRLDDDRAFKVLSAVLTHTSPESPAPLPSALVHAIAKVTLDSFLQLHSASATNSDVNQDSRVRSLLVDIQQRYPKVWSRVYEEASAVENEGSDKEGDEADKNSRTSRKEVLAKALVFLSMVPSTSGQEDMDVDFVVGALDADANVRALAIKEMYVKLGAADEVSQSDMVAIRSSLFARLQDTSLPVIEALYSNPEVLTQVILDTGVKDYADSVSGVLRDPSLTGSGKDGRSIVKLHVDFTNNRLLLSPNSRGEGVDDSSKVYLFYKVVFPLLLFSKPRRRTTKLVWECIEAAEKSALERGGSGVFGVLSGCVGAVALKEGETEGRNVDAFVKANLAFASRIADNIVASNEFASHLDQLISLLQQSSDVHGRSLAYIVAQALISRLSGSHQVAVALQLLTAMNLGALENMDGILRAGEDVLSSLDEANVGTSVYLKPSSRNTLLKLQVAILAFVPRIAKPSGLPLDWLATSSSGALNIVSSVEDTRGSNYVQLVRILYRLSATGPASTSAYSAHLTQALFATLSSDALSFLVGTCLNSKDTQLRYAALYHSIAFIEAHIALCCCIDFQTVLPGILVVVGDEDTRVRSAAVELIEALGRVVDMKVKKPSGVYAFDALYGENSTSLQYLDWSDFAKYVRKLVETKEHFLNDSSFVKIFHEQTLKSARSESKREAGFKQRVLCYLVSHVNSCPLIDVKTGLLRMLEGVSNSVKLQMLQPILKAALEASSASLQENQELVGLLFSAFDESSVKDLNDASGTSWDAFTQALRRVFQSDAPPSLRKVLLQNLRGGLRSGLNGERKVGLCRLLLELCQRDQNLTTECRDVIASMISDTVVAILVLTALQPTTEDSPQRARKRAKVDALNEEEILTSRAASLATLAEILTGVSLTGTLDLVTALLETLNKVVHEDSSGSGEKVFTVQLLMSAIENVATSIPATDLSKITPQALRLDVLVELIRVSQNPQTFNQALLLAATLARLAPNAVLHNIMPIFTFMGSNVFHRDDTYSFKVVQKTIESIVPVMVSSLKDTHPSGLDLWMASRSFLRLFTDAWNHIPRHRRTSFFSQLVDALGPSNFLAPICMLLVDKMVNRVVRQNDADSHNSLNLSLVLMQRYDPSVQLQAILELLREAKRLVAVETGEQGEPTTFLETTSDDERGVKATARRQAQSLLVFVGHSLRGLSTASGLKEPSNETLTAEILLLLLDLGSSRIQSEEGHDDVAKVARSSILDALGVMSAAEFVRGTLVVLQSSDVLAQRGALELFSGQLPNITPKVRAEVAPTIVKIITTVHKSLLPSTEESMSSISFQALSSIATSICPGEESTLTTTVPQVMSHIRERKATLDALRLLHVLVTKLGPRIIPYFKDIVKLCVGLREPTDSSETFAAAVNILQGLLGSIPRFWGNAELSLVINVYLEGEASTSREYSSQMGVFIKTLTKKAPTKVLLPLLCDMWQSLSSDSNKDGVAKLPAFFIVFKRTIHIATRPLVTDHLRTLYGTFLSVFQYCASFPATRDLVEEQAISTFLEVIVKLNEAAFKPFFRKLFDWAFASESSPKEKDSRRITFCNIFSGLLDHFKSLVTPYMSFLFQPIIDILKEFDEDGNDDLWHAIIKVLTKSFVHDERDFWRDERLSQLSKPLIAQLITCVRINTTESKTALTDCLLGYFEAISDDTLLKSANIDVLMHTRSEDPRLRLFALVCSEALWRAHGGKLMGLVHETTTFIAEAAEDENDLVVKEAHRLKNTVESITGPLDI